MIRNILLQMYHEAVSEGYSFLYVDLMTKDKRKMYMERFHRYLIPGKNYASHIYIYIYIMATLTKSEGKVLTYTDELIETILLQLNSSNNYYTSGDDDILFIRSGFNKVLVLYYIYHINRNFSELYNK